MNIKTIISTAGALLLSGSALASSGFNLNESGFNWPAEGPVDNFVGAERSLPEILLSEQELNDSGYNWSSEGISANHIDNSYPPEDYLAEIGYAWQ